MTARRFSRLCSPVAGWGVYLMAAFAFGFVWLAAFLLIPSPIRKMMHYLLQEPSLFALLLIALLVTSPLIALLCRRWIVPERSLWRDLVAGAVIPYAAALLFGLIWALLAAVPILIRMLSSDIPSAAPWWNHLHQFHDAAILPYWAVMLAITSFYVVIPLGILAQFAMKQAGRIQSRIRARTGCTP